MARTVANLDVTSDTFQNWVSKTNELLYSLSTEILTGNSSISNTGTVLEPRKAQLIGRFGANTLVATNELRGGNVADGGYALLTVTSNTLFGGNSSANASYVNSQANVFVNNSVTQVNSDIITITGNTSIKGNTSVTAITVTGNATVSNTIITGTDLFIRSVNTSVNSISIFTGNTYIKSNSTITSITVQTNGTTSNNILSGNLTQITSNLDVTGTLHTIAGNVIFDTTTLFVDATNDRVGVGNTAPDAKFVVTGTANVSGASRFANSLTVIGNTTLANTLSVTGNTTLANTLSVNGNTTLSNTLSVTGNTTLANSLSVTGNSILANSLSVTGNTTLSNTLLVVGAANTLSTLGIGGAANALSTFGVTGAANALSSFGVTGAANALSTFGVTGAANALSTLGIGGAANALSTLGVNGLLFAAGNANIAGQTNTATLYVTTSANVGTVFTVNTTITNSAANVQLTTSATAGFVGIGRTPTSTTKLNVNSQFATDGNSFGIQNHYIVANTSITAPRGYYGLYNYAEHLSLNSDGATSYASDLYAFQSYAFNGPGDAAIDQMYGAVFDARNYANGALGNTVINGIGSRSTYYSFGSGVTSTAYGAQASVAAGNNAITGNIGTAYGVYSSIDSNTSMTIGTGYLFAGQFNGATTTNKFGVYISGESNNYFSSNVSIAGGLLVSTNSSFDSGTLFVDAVNNRVGINNTAPGVALRVTGAADISSTANVQGNANVGGILGVVGALTLSNNIIVAGNAVFSNAISVANASTFANTVSITGAATLANTLAVTGAATFSNTVAITGTTTFNTVSISGESTTFNTNYVIQVTANSNLGATVGSPLLVYSFPKATYSSAKITAQVKTSGGNTQINEIVLAHNTTTPYITVYATVASPLGANNGIYSVAINNANVELSFTQTSSSSAAKIVAHLIK